MAVRAGNQQVFSRVASGNLPAERLATLIGKDAVLATSGQLAYPTTHRADDNQHVGLVSGGHCKISLAASLGVGGTFMAGNSGLAVLAASGQFMLGTVLTAGDSGHTVEALFDITQKSLA